MSAEAQEGAKQSGEEMNWEQLWVNGIERGQLFDRMHALPELVTQLSNGGIDGGDSVLVPGCGRGYDVEAFCRSGLFTRVVGLDISETAAQRAREYLRSARPALREGSFLVAAGDFFDATATATATATAAGDGVFSLVYDYTFLCALPVERRGEWARRMRSLVRVGGSLITAMYPVGKRLDEGGPPFGYDALTLRRLLQDGDGGFVARDGPRQLDETQAHQGRGGRTWWCRWERV